MTPPSVWQVVIILVIVLLLFGGKKIPELMKGLGSGVKNFKKAIKEDEEQDAVQNTTEKIAQNEQQPKPTKTTTESKKED
ncbi:twin-arginine translocase TatA/TatE family subunit [Helicobacter sp. MIT 00-7814]|uniref:twin-arginine translocase TatA/TatE family subunit n=1 Tax=unclassified Helicobacter TaxID=2593540 RepID=UPI000E1E53AB|nr:MULTISPECIES: twin-arginine translocase TatA/TatE family subunit [unclassified Helicobacter]RDU55852.1 twin-arginine translocase TatA/TatE family subunit [Helicobacter sp. MIT 00-7814]RDU56810.1 twin-arginine translocase TatA/TatE family subunit [Helicobacter sp. MIT 99-10781]